MSVFPLPTQTLNFGLVDRWTIFFPQFHHQCWISIICVKNDCSLVVVKFLSRAIVSQSVGKRQTFFFKWTCIRLKGKGVDKIWHLYVIIQIVWLKAHPNLLLIINKNLKLYTLNNLNVLPFQRKNFFSTLHAILNFCSIFHINRIIFTPFQTCKNVAIL